MDDAIARAKRSLRRAMSQRRRAVPAAVRDAASAAIANAVLALPEFEAAARVVAYVALPDEVALDAVVQRVLASGRTLLLPRVEGDRLAFVATRALAELVPGAFGVLAPPAGLPATTLTLADLVLVPGLAFDRRGGRLGRGAGLYDQSLPRGIAPFGVGYAFQLVESVPTNAQDRRMAGVVTEDGVTRVPAGDREPDPG